MLLLTTRGRVSGDAHTVPLLYLQDADRLAVVASYGGRPHHPDWYLNLVAQPRCTVQVEGERRIMTATTAGPDDRSRWWQAALAAHPGYADYQAKTDREIPIVVMRSP
jgi:deazaflavin-dependent oxidoreductase (nitroreductase family)